MNIYRGRSHTEVYLASILYDSIEDQNLSSVKKLLFEKRADPNIILPKKGISCFHLVIGNDSAKFAMEVTLLIVQCGGDPNVLSDEGITPVHIAAAWGRTDILQLLLNCGGDPEITDNYYKSALHYALNEGWGEAASLIKDYISSQRLFICSNYKGDIPYTINLDKILFDTGFLVGEYEVSSREDIKPHLELNALPEENSQDYVLNWCNNHKLEPTDLSERYNLELSECSCSTASLESKNNSFLKSYHRNEITNKIMQKPSNNLTFRNKNYGNYISKDVIHYKTSSKESGILTSQDFIEDKYQYSDDVILKGNISDNESCIIKESRDTNSDYWTCTDGSESINILEKNIYIYPENGLNKSTCQSSDQDMVSVSEVYKHTDTEENIVLYEKRTLAPSTKGSQNGSVTASSSLSSLPKSFTYDTDCLRQELTTLGFSPGPITKTTKRVYLKKLYQLKRHLTSQPLSKNNEMEYSPELQRTLKNVNWYEDLTEYQSLEDSVKQQFTVPNPTRKWREGTTKSSFTYLLLDPRITQDLPIRCGKLEKGETWKTFLSAIFYVGKGKRSRPYSHLYTAVTCYNKTSKLKADSRKMEKILDIWKENYGVVCLHVFQNVIPAEAYTREAAMISALRLNNLTNIKSGDFYGVTAAWTLKQKNSFGVYLLYRAMKIFLNEGERQLFPNDID